MRKFKIGDKVRVVKNMSGDEEVDRLIGKKGTIVYVETSYEYKYPYKISFDEKDTYVALWSEDELELISEDELELIEDATCDTCPKLIKALEVATKWIDEFDPYGVAINELDKETGFRELLKEGIED